MPSEPRVCPRFPPRNLNGKEGVNGSSPLEGFTKFLQISPFCSAREATLVGLDVHRTSTARWDRAL